MALQLVEQHGRDVWLKHCSADSQNVDTEEERNLGRAVGHQGWDATKDDEDMPNTADNNTPEDEVVPTKLGVGEVSKEHGQTVGKQAERLGGCIGNLFAQAKGTLGILATTGGRAKAVTTRGQRLVNVVGPNHLAAVVGSTLAELNSAEEIRNWRKRARDTAERSHLLVSGLAFIIGV